LLPLDTFVRRLALARLSQARLRQARGEIESLTAAPSREVKSARDRNTIQMADSDVKSREDTGEKILPDGLLAKKKFVVSTCR
jgi:hypothetical protein